MNGNVDAIAGLDLGEKEMAQLRKYTDAIMESEEALV
jgi:hypothetical protein